MNPNCFQQIKGAQGGTNMLLGLHISIAS